MRLDAWLCENKFYSTRAKAAAAARSGLVLVNGTVAAKPGQPVRASDKVSAGALPYISGRGSLKLAAALDHWNIDPAGLECLDVGASTGGFTETLLKRGAAHVLAVDVGAGQLIPELRGDRRVESLENTDIRDVTPRPVDLIAIDVSFVSLTEIAGTAALWGSPKIIALIKPQFEVARKHRGVIKSEIERAGAVDSALRAFAAAGYEPNGVIDSPILGGSGNKEFLAYMTLRVKPAGIN
jgi:23S rRNA (cytidine1920-2'-O)/16S rRNA (cytidine1409-2'-O)-methyltransferase